MRLGEDVVGDRQATPCALAGRPGGGERLEKIVPDIRRDSGAIFTHAEFNRVADGRLATFSVDLKLWSALLRARLLAA